MFSQLDYIGSAFDEHTDDSWEHTLPYTGGDVPVTEIGYSDDAVAELNEPTRWLTLDQPQPGWNFGPFHDSEHLPYDLVPQSYSTLSGSAPSLWNGAQQTPSVSMSCSLVNVAAPGQFQSHGGYQQIQDGSSRQTQRLRSFAGTLPPATDHTNAMIPSGSAVDEHGVASSTAQESLSNLLRPPKTSSPAIANNERHHLFDDPPDPVVPYPFPAHEHSHHCGCHKEYQRYDRQSDLQQPHSLMPSAVMMERGNSHRSTSSTHSRRSKRSLPPTLTNLRIACEICNRPFTGEFCRRNLTRHMQTAHGGDNTHTYACTVPGCDRTYKRGDARRVHECKVHPTLFAPRQSRSKRPDEEG